MRIGGMDASNAALVSTQSTGVFNTGMSTKENRDVSAKDGKNVSHIAEVERRETPILEKVVIQAIEKANKAICSVKKKFEFSIHEGTKEIMVKVIDSDTNEVIREIPPEKILDMVAKMWEIAGIIVDERR